MLQPKTLCVSGNYTGVGKSTALEEIEKFLKESLGTEPGKYHMLSVGPLLSKYQNEDPRFAHLRKEQSAAKKLPYGVINLMLSFEFEKLEVLRKKNVILVIDGARDIRELEYIYSLGEAGMIPPMVPLLLESDRNDCFERVYERTKKDHRADFSIDGQPGVPDPDKIHRKLSWEFTLYREAKMSMGNYWLKGIDIERYVCQNIGSEESFRRAIKNRCNEIFAPIEVLS